MGNQEGIRLRETAKRNPKEGVSFLQKKEVLEYPGSGERVTEQNGTWRPHTSLENLRAIDHELTTRWSIRCQSVDESEAWITEHVPGELVEQYFRLVDDRAHASTTMGRVSPGQDAAWYDFMAHPLLNGPIHSERRAFFLDACALAQGVIEARGVTGGVLDVGCHSGYVASTLARLNPTLKVTGVDASAPAIALARAQSDFPANLEFVVARCPARLEEAFNLVLCVDSAPRGKRGLEPFVTWVAGLLADGGLVVFVDDASSLWTTSGIQKRLSSAGLGFVLADVLGGWTGNRFDSKLVLAFEKGADRAVPKNYAALATQGWDGTGFPAYCHAPETSWGEKTIQWFRARQAEGPAIASGERQGG